MRWGRLGQDARDYCTHDQLMLMHNVTSYAIVALTFTNKAAREMKERIAHFLPGYQLPMSARFTHIAYVY